MDKMWSEYWCSNMSTIYILSTNPRNTHQIGIAHRRYSWLWFTRSEFDPWRAKFSRPGHVTALWIIARAFQQGFWSSEWTLRGIKYRPGADIWSPDYLNGEIINCFNSTGRAKAVEKIYWVHYESMAIESDQLRKRKLFGSSRARRKAGPDQ